MSLSPLNRTHSLDIGPVHRELPLFSVSPDLAIAVLNILGDTELTEAAAQELSHRLAGQDYAALVTAETKSIPLAHALSVCTRKPYVVLRKNYKPYMGEPLSAETLSITTGAPQTLYLDGKDRQLLQGQGVVLVDDVISTGSTLAAMRQLMSAAEARVVAAAAICTEGDAERHGDVIALAHLPLFPF